MSDLQELLDICGSNLIIADAFTKANSIINNPQYERIGVSYSGGSDSDIMLDLLWRVDKDKKCKYVYFDTGLEYQATKDHVAEVAEKYGITIETLRPKVNIIQAVRKNGIPFISKRVSQFLGYLMKSGFGFEDGTVEELIAKYPNSPKSYIEWWCNAYGKVARSMCNINYNSGLKEFLIENPIPFTPSSSCCHYAKKNVGRDFRKAFHIQVECTGVRRAEGCQRAVAFNNCFSPKGDIMQYRPLFWFTDAGKTAYEQLFGVTHSKCYTEYGLKRTGCAGCPYGYMHDANERAVIQKYEPKLWKACQNIFGESYAFTERYSEFRQEFLAKKKSAKWKQSTGQIDIFDVMKETEDD